MLEPAVIILRLLQYLGAMVLLGSSLFFVFGLGAARSPRTAPFSKPLLCAAALLLALASALGIVAQTSVLAGSIADGLKSESLLAVVGGMDLGKAAVVRTVAASLALVTVLVAPTGRLSWSLAGLLGAVATASFAWSGHGAATEGAGKVIHLLSDIAHGWAAAGWVGALVGFALLLRPAAALPDNVTDLHRAFHGFAGVGTFLVAVLIATGIVNSWFLVGPNNLQGLWTTPYGRLLMVKIVLFLVMLGLAASNRFRLTPALGEVLANPVARSSALASLRRSVAIETFAGAAILALVAWFGTLAAPSAL